MINEGYEGEDPGHVEEIRNNSKEDIGQVSAGMIHLTQFAKRLKIERTGRSDQIGDIWASLSSHAWFH